MMGRERPLGPYSFTYALLISAFAIAAAIFASPQGLVQEAHALPILSVIDGSTCAPNFAGTWDGDTNTCTLPGFTIANGDGVEIPAGVTVSLPAVETILISDGTLFVAGTLNVDGGLDIGDSAVATVEVNSGGILHLSGGIDFEFPGASLNVNDGGTLNINSGGNIFAGGDTPGVINIGGTLNVNDGGELDEGPAGILNVLSGGTLVTLGSGVVDADGSTLNVNDGGSFGGTLHLSNQFEPMTINAVITTDTLTITGFSEVDGTIDIGDGGTVNLVGSVELHDSINVNDGGTLNVNDFLYLSGSPSTLNVNSNGTVNVNDGGTVRVGGDGVGDLNVNDGGTVNVNDGGRIEIITGSTINVLSGGTLVTLGAGVVDAEGGSTINVSDGGSFGGTLHLTSGSDPVTINAVITTDTLAVTGFSEVDGTIDIGDGGTVNLVGSVELHDSINVNDGGTLNVNDSLYLNGSPSTLNVNDGGTLNVNNGGTLDVGGDGVGVLNVNDGGTLNVNNGGTLDVASFSQVMVFCEGTFNNNGGTVTGEITYEFCPSEATGDLITEISTSIIDKRVKSSLLGPLKQVQKILDDGNPDNDSAACGKLDEFIANVNSKEASGKLSSTQAQQYRDAANAIKSALGC